MADCRPVSLVMPHPTLGTADAAFAALMTRLEADFEARLLEAGEAAP